MSYQQIQDSKIRIEEVFFRNRMEWGEQGACKEGNEMPRGEKVWCVTWVNWSREKVGEAHEVCQSLTKGLVG